MRLYLTATSSCAGRDALPFNVKVDAQKRSIDLHPMTAYGPYLSLDEDGARWLVGKLTAALDELGYPLISAGGISASGPTIRLLHCPACDDDRVVDLCEVDEETRRLSGVCLTCHGGVEADEYETEAVA